MRPALRILPAVAILAAVTGTPAAAEPVKAPFIAEEGDVFSFSVRYFRGTILAGKPEPVIAVDYDLDLAVTAASADGFQATVRNHGMNVTIDRQRVLAPPDFDSLLLLALDDVTAEIDLTPEGALIRVANWDSLRDEIAAKAKELAGDSAAMIAAVDAFLPAVGPADAVQIVARPLALSAPGRIVSFDPPEKTSILARDVDLPSFATYAGGSWSFDLVRRPEVPDSISVEWLGVPAKEELEAILAPVGEQLARGSDLSEEARAEIVASGRMWQRFAATYGATDGRLIAFQGVMELQAGPLHRRVALEAAARSR